MVVGASLACAANANNNRNGSMRFM
jgi:hypothetical protein